ncbi:MAG: DUF2244 domain-containing protein [Gammaproteobacteria bacterium]|jgi:uncharacterized membrane protein|nr:DUF2244 domain-containing protein [Gammaproteobacteria bacterium]MBT3726005.1 DUF2244 domain-containing protein [Gammaproteobacteria bacterium]MBT4075136.1 DUF2244 domain-containing protein [Gammaproteobacteria bacterium]MBT4195278.1 DUF2244 domain-containing protein [Gammaproteobacteria bacterium]MBT4448621.1 DUF2244 domain-containing protein [Gammaproteobacteria bacterium]
MILEKADPNEHQYDFLIRPNRSMTAKGMTLFVIFVGLAVFLIAIRFVLLGAWVILPFAILEVALLAAGFWLYERASRYRETVQLSRKNILITQESVKGRESWQFNPHWVQVVLSLDPDDWYPSQLFIRSHGEQVEIGTCLTNQEREELAKALKQAMPDILKAA